MVQKLNYQGIEFSVATKHDKIEEQNSININVFGYGNKQFYPMYVSKQHNKVVLNLLLITEGEKQHYVLLRILIESISAYIVSKFSVQKR